METLIINFKNKRDYKLIKELVSRLDAQIEGKRSKKAPKSKIKSIEELRAMWGIAKGRLISKKYLRNLSC